ncbi:MAG: oligosaccharide flippase family protein [Acidobacteriaceae bacterium]
MSNMRTLWKHSSHYVFGRVGLMLLGLVSFPILARLLSVRQYGELSLLLKLALLWTVLSKAGLQNAALRFLPEAEKGEAHRKQACITTLIAESLLISGGFCLLGFLLVYLHVFALSDVAASLIPLALGLVVIRSVQPVLSGILRSEGRTLLFNLCEVLGKSLGIGLSLSALFFLSVNLHYYLAGLFIAEASVVLALLLWLSRTGWIRIASLDRSFARRSFLFSAPLIAYELASVVLDSGDRLLIGHYLGFVQVGFYSAAYSIATYTEEVLMTPVNLALFPVYMKIWVAEGASATAHFLSRAFDIFFTLACGLILVVLLTSHDLIALLASRKFLAAEHLLPVLVTGLLVYALHIFFNAALLIHRKTLVLTGVTAVCCVLNIALNMLLLPRIGLMGAALATLVSYLVLVIAMAVASRRYLSFPIPVRGMCLSALLAMMIFALCRHLAAPSLVLDLGLRSASALILYAVGLLAIRPELQTRLLERLRSRSRARSTPMPQQADV